MIDLHVHSNKSDGSLTPHELVDYARVKGITAFALTDHDTMDGVPEAMDYALSLGGDVEVIPGIELSCENEGRDVHIVGLYMDMNSPAFIGRLADFRESRELRNAKMMRLLQEHGVMLTIEELENEFPGAVITRGLIAKLMYRKGYVKSMREAFDRYIGDHCDCYLPRERLMLEDGIDMIKASHGVAVLAHPVLYHMGRDKLDAMVGRLSKAGLDGIEVKYTTYTPSDEREIRALARKYNLLESGGSDYHGDTKPDTDMGVGYGRLYLHESMLEPIRKRAGDKINGCKDIIY